MGNAAANELWFLFRGSDLLVYTESNGLRLPNGTEVAQLGFKPAGKLAAGCMGEKVCFTGELPIDTAVPEGMAFQGLRAVYGNLEQRAYRLAGRAVQLVEWNRTHRFCGHCGTPTTLNAELGAKVCPACGAQFFPRISPAIIVLIRDGDRILLARSQNWPPGRFSNVAGFVEPGETLEEAVEREVAEEVGVKLKNIRYWGSQPWPFPHSLMVGFTADYAGGEIKVQESEIAEAAWFDVNNLPNLPGPISIARRLIDSFIAEQAQKAV